MSRPRIENSEQLHAEINRLKEEVRQRELKVKGRIHDLKEGLKPENILGHFVSSLTGIKIDKATFLKNGLSWAVSLLVQRLLHKTEDKIEAKVGHWLDNIFDKVKNVVTKFSHNGKVESETIEEEEEEDS